MILKRQEVWNNISSQNCEDNRILLHQNLNNGSNCLTKLFLQKDDHCFSSKNLQAAVHYGKTIS